jgi:hypothetical protein
MALYGMENFAFGTVSGVFDASQTTLPLVVTHGARFGTFPARAVLWNIQDFSSAHDAFIAGDAEVIELVTRVGDVFTVIKRGQDGTAGIATAAGGIYQVAVSATRGQWLKVCRAPPDSSGPFDAIIEGTAGVVANALARFVKDNALDDAVFSIQGSPTNGDATSVWIGNTTVPDLARFDLLKNTATTDTLSVLLNSIQFLTMQGRDRMGIRKVSPAQPDGVDIGQTVRLDKHIGMGESTSVISGGQILTGATNFIRVSAEGGPGSDDLDEILLTESPIGNRMIIIIEPTTTAHNITVRDKFVAGGTANISLKDITSFVMNTQFDKLALISDGIDNDEWVEIWRTPASTPPPNYVLVQDEKTSGTEGGTFTSGSWQTRDINTEVNDAQNLAAISSNQVTLQPGTYRCNITAPAQAVLDHKIRLQNITDIATTLVGTSEFADKSTSSRIRGLFTIAAAKAFEVQHQCSSTQAVDGFGAASGFGVVEVYAVAEFQKVD